MAGGGTDIRPWNAMKVTADQNYTTATDIQDFLDAFVQNSHYWFALKDNPKLNYKEIQNEFICMYYGYQNNGGTNIFTGNGYIRVRSTAFQTRSISSTEDAILNSGETITIFYQ